MTEFLSTLPILPSRNAVEDKRAIFKPKGQALGRVQHSALILRRDEHFGIDSCTQRSLTSVGKLVVCADGELAGAELGDVGCLLLIAGPVVEVYRVRPAE